LEDKRSPRAGEMRFSTGERKGVHILKKKRAKRRGQDEEKGGPWPREKIKTEFLLARVIHRGHHDNKEKIQRKKKKGETASKNVSKKREKNRGQRQNEEEWRRWDQGDNKRMSSQNKEKSRPIISPKKGENRKEVGGNGWGHVETPKTFPPTVQGNWESLHQKGKKKPKTLGEKPDPAGPSSNHENTKKNDIQGESQKRNQNLQRKKKRSLKWSLAKSL